MKTRKTNKKGISLIVLVITIIVMIILAAAVIIAISNNNIITKAQEAVNAQNLKLVEEIAQTAWLDAYIGGARTEVELQAAVDAAMTSNKIDTNKYEADASTTGVNVTIKQDDSVWYDGWDAVYIAGDGSWSGQIPLSDFPGITEMTEEEVVEAVGGEIPIMIKCYKTGSKVTPEPLPEGDAYRMVVTGTGEMPDVANGAWVRELNDYFMGTTTELPIMAYTTEIIIEEGITSIGFANIYGTMSCNTITLPSTLTEVKDGAIWGHPGDIVVASSNPNYISDNGMLYNKNKTTIIHCPATKTSVTLPSGLKEIAAAAFMGCSNLTAITLPEGLETIGNEAFSSCTQLTDITIPSTVESMGNEAFAICTALKTVKIRSNKLTSLEHSIFSDCTGLETITIPKNITTIEHSVFDNCTSLTKVNYTGTSAEWGSITIREHNEALTNATKEYGYVIE